MTASRSDCSKDPADEIPVVAGDAGDIGEAASSPRLREVLFTCPNMSTQHSNVPAAVLRLREASYSTSFKNPSLLYPLSISDRIRINEWAIHNNVCALVTFPSSTLSHRETRCTYFV